MANLQGHSLGQRSFSQYMFLIRLVSVCGSHVLEHSTSRLEFPVMVDAPIEIDNVLIRGHDFQGWKYNQMYIKIY